MIHVAFNSPHWNISFLSFVALERSIPTGCLTTSANESPNKVLIQMQEPEERTFLDMLEVKAFKGIRTPCHQCHDPPKIFLAIPRQYEFSEAKTTWQVQQSAHGRSSPFRTVKFKGPSQWGRDQRLEVDPVVAIARPVFSYIQVLEKGQGANEAEN